MSQSKEIRKRHLGAGGGGKGLEAEDCRGCVSLEGIDLFGLISTIFITISYLLPLVSVPVFVFYSFSSFFCLIEYFIWFHFLSFLAYWLYLKKTFLVIALEFAIYILQVIQVHFQPTLYHLQVVWVLYNNQIIIIPSSQSLYDCCHSFH